MTITHRDVSRQMDREDPLRGFRDRFFIPITDHGEEVIYFCGNSLGLQPKTTSDYLNRELERWATQGVDGHFDGADGWYGYHGLLSESLAAVVGARPSEVVAMNSLTTNLHLLMVSFYRPTPQRFKIMIEGGAFPSDLYAVHSQAQFHGFSPQEAIVELSPRQGEALLRTDDILQAIDDEGDQLALIMLGGVNYYTGQFFDLPKITAAGHGAGAKVGFDLAHAAGNVPLRLHDWGPDFAAWCSYKYLNAGPGAVSGVFVHDRHGDAPELPRFAGWWGVDPQRRFEMAPRFNPQTGAAGWQLSNAPILSMAALRASLAIMMEAGMAQLRQKSEKLTAYLVSLIDELPQDSFEIITPGDPDHRGCQVSILAHHDSQGLHERLTAANVVCDYRRPNVIRLAPVPLYNSFEEVWRFWKILADSV